MKKNNHTSKGFTLLETLASITILSFVIIGPLSVLTGSSAFARQTKDVIVSTHLAEEGIELIQNQYDSIYLLCKKDPGNPFCTPVSVDENSGQISWRLFKNRFIAGDTAHPLAEPYPSCYKVDNLNGCSYDYLDMIGEVTQMPTRHDASGIICPYLVELTVDALTNTFVTDANGILHEVVVPGKRHTYVCKSTAEAAVALNPTTATTSQKAFKRTVSLEALPTFETGAMDTQYNDDLRITSTVIYKGVNGVSFPVSVVRFMHAQQ